MRKGKNLCHVISADFDLKNEMADEDWEETYEGKHTHQA